MPLLSITEQQRIAAFLDEKTAAVDELIALKERQVALLLRKRQALISRAVTRGLNPDAPLRDSGVAWLAWVIGTARYDTLVDVINGTPLATCSCPYDGVCKHAVAVVLACQMPDARGHTLPTVSKNDRRFAVLEAAGEEWDDDDWDEDFDEDDDDLDDAVRGAAATQKSVGIGPTVIPAGDTAVAALRLFLEETSNDQLIDLLMDLAQRFPEVQRALDARQTASDDAPASCHVRL